MTPDLIKKLQAVPQETILGIAIANGIKEGRYEDVEKMLKECWTDNEYATRQVLGFPLENFLKVM